MAFRSSKQARCYVGILGAAAYARSVSVTSPTEMLEVTTLADDDKAFIPGLTNGGQFSIDGPLDVDGSANGQFDVFADQQQAADPTVVTYLPLGTDGAAWLIETRQTSLETMSSVSGTVDWSAGGQITGPADYAGVVLENNTTVTSDTDGSDTDNGAATSNGAVFHLHVTAYSGLTSDDIIVEGSTSGAFAGEETTIATFTQVTGLTSERVEVTGTVPRYLRVVDDVTGTGSITRLVAVARR